ncbi:alkaline phosphatase-like [Teleopsis dalmanni]|nr:alkaline phosphatase-like [Teleopsis dalmanni]
MTAKAIEVLEQNPKGYFLFVEGGKIDKAHHANKAKLALDETAEFSKAVATAHESTNEKDTLIVVSADHSHTMSVAGYAPRSDDIFGVGAIAEDELPYLVLSYANGPSYKKFFDTKKNVRLDPSTVLSGDIDDVFPATAPMDSETHGGEDVPVYATGPWSHLFSGVYEQSTIPHLMAYAGCLGHGQKACDK